MFTKLGTSDLTQPWPVNSYLSIAHFQWHQNKKFRGPFTAKAPGLRNRPLDHNENCDSPVHVLPHRSNCVHAENIANCKYISDFFSSVTHLESTKQMYVGVTVICNMVTVHNADTCRGCHLVTPVWCLDQTVPWCWTELCYLQKYATVKVPYGCLHPQVNKAALTHSQCGRASLPGYRMNCHSAAGHRPQGHWTQAVNIMTQFMIPSILEQEPEWCCWYSNCATNLTVRGLSLVGLWEFSLLWNIQTCSGTPCGSVPGKKQPRH